MKIRIWKPGEKGNPCVRHYYYQFFQRKKRYRGVLEARNAEQAKQGADKIWDEEWNKRYDPEPPEPEQVLFADFVGETYLPSKTDNPVVLCARLSAWFRRLRSSHW